MLRIPPPRASTSIGSRLPRTPKRRETKKTPARSAAAGRPAAPADEVVASEDTEARSPEDAGESPSGDEETGEAGQGEDDALVEDAEADLVDDSEARAASEEDAERAAAREPGEAGPIERFDALQTYLREVQRHPLLTPEETQSLAVKFVQSQDSTAAARLVTSNLRLVVKIAYEYRRAYKNIMDLIQEGNIGLMQAVKRYDPYRGVKLSSYAAWWIRAYILRFILNNWRLVKLGTTQAQRKLFFNLRKKRAELQALGIDPTNAEIAKRLNVAESEVAEMDVRLQANERSLDAPVGDSEGRAIAKIDMMPSGGEGPEAAMAEGELQALLKEKLATFRKTLSGKDKDLAIFDERLVADEPLTLQELGDRFGISRERVRQLEQRLTGKLREFLRDEMGDAVEVA